MLRCLKLVDNNDKLICMGQENGEIQLIQIEKDAKQLKYVDQLNSKTKSNAYAWSQKR